MEALQEFLSQLQFSLTWSQIIFSVGVMALGAIWGRFKWGALLAVGTLCYWSYTTNKPALMALASANIPMVVLTGALVTIMGFFLLYAWNAPSSR